MSRHLKLVHILNEMPMVESVHAKGETIGIELKASSANEKGSSA